MRNRLIFTLLGAAGVAGAVLTLSGVRSPVTGPLTLVFLLLAPAVCVAAMLTDLDPLGRAIVAGAAGLVLSAGIAEIMLVTSHWSPRHGVAAVGAVCVVLAVPATLHRRRAARVSEEAVPAGRSGDEDAWAFEP
jgi:hypothetical protein